jgi:hypothetical protein
MHFGVDQNADTSETSLDANVSHKTLAVSNRRNATVSPATGTSPSYGLIGSGQVATAGFSHHWGILGQSVRASLIPAGVVGIGGAANNTGVEGVADQGSSAFGVWGRSQQGLAGVFGGKVSVSGELTKGSGGFKIDHPLDPENKYLVHSFVESPDMLNVYSGNVETDDSCQAVVTLPGYFEALNQGFTYQLTPVGQFAQAIVSEEVRENRFSIRTDRPNVKVSWQVTGIRQDAYAAQNRISPEEEKTDEEKGFFLHPEAYDQPHSRHIHFEREKAHDEQRALINEQVKQLFEYNGGASPDDPQ